MKHVPYSKQNILEDAHHAQDGYVYEQRREGCLFKEGTVVSGVHAYYLVQCVGSLYPRLLPSLCYLPGVLYYSTALQYVTQAREEPGSEVTVSPHAPTGV